MLNRRDLLKATTALTIGAALSTLPSIAQPEARAMSTVEILDSGENVIYTVPQPAVAGYSFDGIPLKDAQFQNMDLTGCTFQGCALQGANFHNADLTNGDLSSGAILRDAILTGCNLEGCLIGDTYFDTCTTLHLAENLDNANFGSPSHLDRATLMACLPGLTNAAMVSLGYTQGEVTALRGIWDA